MTNPGDEAGWLDLADAVGLLRAQIEQAQQRAHAAGVRFAVGEVSVEFELELARTRGAEGELRFGIAALRGAGGRTARGTHRVSLTLQPRLADSGREVEIGDREEANGPVGEPD